MAKSCPYLHKLGKGIVGVLLVLEFVFGFDLVGAVKNKRREVDNMLQENIANLGYNCVRLLTFEERFAELRVDIVHVLDIVKDSVDK